MNMIAEFALYAINPDQDKKLDEELLKLLKLKIN
jgi:hypothetical protein